MNILKMLQALSTVWDGKKVNTGAIVMLVALGLQYLGMGNDDATNTASGIMMGTGAVVTTVGLIHKAIKAKQAKSVVAEEKK